MLYLFNEIQQLIKRIPREHLLALVQRREITSDKSELLNDMLEARVPYSETAANAAYMAVKEESGEFTLYRILTAKEIADSIELSGVNFGSDELDGYIIKDIRPQAEDVKSLLERMFSSADASDWQIKYHQKESWIPEVTDTFYYVTLREALKQLQTHGMEFTFTCDVTSQGITAKYLHLYDKIGEYTGKRFSYGDTALEIVKEVNRTNIVTSFIGRGRGEEVGDGYGRRIEFDSVEWSKKKGDPLDKPKGQIFLEDPEATKIYGIPQGTGMRKREKVIIFDDCEEPESLLRLTYEALIENQRPLVQFSSTVLGFAGIGDTVSIHRHDRGYHYETRVFKQEIDLVNDTKRVEFGDNLTSNSSSSMVTTTKALADLEEKKMTFYQSTEIGKFQDDIMRGAGANGGSIYQVNGIEAGVSDSREVYEMVFMDGKSISDSQHFMIQNSEGIGFKKCQKGEWKDIKEVHKGESNTAWTIDSKFNADFIQAGKVKADIFESSFSACGDQLKMASGAVSAYDVNKKKAMEYNRKGMQFYKSDGSTLGYMGTTTTAGNPFAGASTPTPVEDNSIVINSGGDGKYIIMSASAGTGFMMLGNGKTYYFGDLDVQGTLRQNGLPIGQGGGTSGGGGTGGIPGELTTDEERRAWEIYDILINGYGYTKEAACGILGNIQQETGGTFDPTTAQIGGPAYGIVQWDGSAYPLVGPATYDGATYVQNLCNAAGISGWNTIRGQVQLIDWCMYNGQWLGAVSPTSVAEFKTLSSPETAAYAFEMNFERPAAAHPERQTYAREWYNKFKDLRATTSTGAEGLTHLNNLIGTTVGNGQCYALSAEYSGVLGGCGLGAGTKYAISHAIGNTACACLIGEAYDWNAVGWSVIMTPSLEQLVAGAIVNWNAGAAVGGPNSWTTDGYYGHTGVIKEIQGGTIITYEQNTEYGQVVAVCQRSYIPGAIRSICIPPE